MVKGEFIKCPYKETPTYTDVYDFTVNPADRAILLHMLLLLLRR